MSKNILKSIALIKERLILIKEAKRDYKKKLLAKNYYLDVLKLYLIEIGEESKIVNDILLENEKSWDDIISLSYNLRISLTHYYKKIDYSLIEIYIEEKLPIFENKINELELKYKNLNKKKN